MQRNFHQVLIKIYHTYMGKIRPFMNKTGLSPGQPKILSYLKSNSDALQKDLAKSYSIEAATVSRLLNNMELQGLITRSISENNKRATFVNITEKGLQKFNEFDICRQKIEEAAFLNFTDEEKEIFIDLFYKIYDNLKNFNNF